MYHYHVHVSTRPLDHYLDTLTMASAMLKELWAAHRRNQANRRRARSRRQGPEPGPSFLSLPPEIRLNVYSYMISPSSASRSLRATCRQIKEEIDHEDCKTFLRRLTAIHFSKAPTHIHLLAPTLCHHVDIKVKLPQLVPGAELHTVAIMYNEMQQLLQCLPLNTRSVTIVIKPKRQCRGHDFDIFYCSFTFELYKYLNALPVEARAAMDLRTLQVLAADPIRLTLEVPLKGAWRRLSGFEIKGLKFELRGKRKGFQIRTKCPTEEKYSRLSREWMCYLRARGQFRPRYQRGCVG